MGLFEEKFRRKKSQDVVKTSKVDHEKSKKEPKESKSVQASVSTLRPGLKEQGSRLELTLFVGNLPPKTTKKMLKQFFTDFGCDVDSVRFRSAPLELTQKMPYHDTKLVRRIAGMTGLVNAERSLKAFVVFKSVEGAEKGLALNMELFNGKHVIVDRASEKSSGDGGQVKYEPSRSAFLGNLPFDIEEEDIISFFNNADHLPQVQNEIEAVRVVHDKATGIGKGFGYVLFNNAKAAKAAIDLNGNKLKEREIRITRVKNSIGSQNPDSKTNRNAFKRRTKNKGNAAQSWQGRKAKASGDRRSKQSSSIAKIIKKNSQVKKSPKKAKKNKTPKK